jgi:hypothetical protein
MPQNELSTVIPRTYWLQSPGLAIFYCTLAVVMFGMDGWRILFAA